jgi:hypothetical protein
LQKGDYTQQELLTELHRRVDRHLEDASASAEGS